VPYYFTALYKKGILKKFDMLKALEDQFQIFIKNLIKGNLKKAKRTAALKLKDSGHNEVSIIALDLVENTGQQQAIKNAILNIPSVFPGIGTIISFWLAGAENLLMLDQSVSLILTLEFLYGTPMDDEKMLEGPILHIIGKAYNIVEEAEPSYEHAITKAYMTKILPQRYLNKGVNRIITRLFPPRRKSRLLPGGIGMIVSAVDGYKTIVKVGHMAIKHLDASRQETS